MGKDLRIESIHGVTVIVFPRETGNARAWPISWYRVPTRSAELPVGGDRMSNAKFCRSNIWAEIHALIADDCARQPAGSPPRVPCRQFATLIASAFTSFMVPTLAAGTALFAPGPRMSAGSRLSAASARAALGCQVETSPSVSRRAAIALDQKARLDRGCCMVGYDARFIGRHIFPAGKRGSQRRAVEKTVPGHTSLPFTRPHFVRRPYSSAFQWRLFIYVKHMFRCFFMSCAVGQGHMCEEEERRGGLKPYMPRRNMAAVIPLTRNSFVLELEKRFSEKPVFHGD